MIGDWIPDHGNKYMATARGIVAYPYPEYAFYLLMSIIGKDFDLRLDSGSSPGMTIVLNP